jgi:hypothetical protein
MNVSDCVMPDDGSANFGRMNGAIKDQTDFLSKSRRINPDYPSLNKPIFGQPMSLSESPMKVLTEKLDKIIEHLKDIKNASKE